MALGQLGLVFGKLGAGRGGGSRPTAPVLAMDPVWTSADTTPDFTIIIDNSVIAGDAVTLQIQATGGSWSSIVVNVTESITAGEISALEIDLTTGALSGGTYDARCKVHHLADSAWSNTVTFSIDNTAITWYFLGF